jgi:cell division protein FtsB
VAAVYEQIRPFVFTGLFTALIVYFGIQAMTGDRGLLLEQARETTLSDRTAELKRLTEERKALETRVTLLQDTHLSRDLLEERARVILGYADPRDYVIRMPEPAPRRS